MFVHIDHSDMRTLIFPLPLLLVLTACSGPGIREEARPNIILVMADDLGIEGLGCYGGTSYETPNLDLMAKNGLRFTHAYSQPLCTPTRIQLMTGKYNHRNWLWFGVLDPGEKTIGHLMQEAGYKTCIAGKWQLHSYDPPDFPGAETRRGTGMHPQESGFDEYSLFHSLHTEDKGSRYANPTYLRNGLLHKEVEDAYGEDLSLEFIGDFLARHMEDPVFVYYPMALPHGPFVPTPLSEAWEERDRRLEKDPLYFSDMVEYLDVLMGRLQDIIESLGMADNTLILFYSDNGTPGSITSYIDSLAIPGGKGYTTQSGIRVPLIAYWPGMVEPGLTDELVDASDFLPTLGELAGIEVPGEWNTDGQSFVPSLFETDAEGRDHAFFWYDPRPGWDKAQFDREIFALDHEYKLYSDGRMFAIDGLHPVEKELDTLSLTEAARKARTKLRKAIREEMGPPLSSTALLDPATL